jgi:heat shock protein HslJ
VAPSGKERFRATFEADGRLGLQADCNACGARYVAGAGVLEVQPMACTRAYCASAPLDTQFAGLVGSASSWSIEEGRLTLRAPAGVVILRK